LGPSDFLALPFALPVPPAAHRDRHLAGYRADVVPLPRLQLAGLIFPRITEGHQPRRCDFLPRVGSYKGMAYLAEHPSITGIGKG